MHRFEWLNATSVAEAAGAGATTVAAAMMAPTGGRVSQDAIVLKAGGIDLLDLMKEGLLQPRRVVNLRGIAGLDQIIEQSDGTVRVGAMVLLATLASNAVILQRYAALARRQSVAAATMLVLPLRAPPLRPQRRRSLLRLRWRQSVPRHLRSSRLRHSASVNICDRPCRLRRQRRAGAAGWCAACNSVGTLLPAPGHRHYA